MRAALLLCLASAAASAQSFDFIRQDVDVDLTGSTPELVLDLTVKAVQAGGTFDFLNPPSTIASFEVDGVAVTPAPHPQYPTFVKRATFGSLEVGATARVRMKLSGAMQCRPTPTSPPACFTEPAQTLLLPVSQDAAWYFVNLYADADPFESTVTVRAPAAQTVLAGHGAGTSTDLADGTKRWSYSLAVPLDSLFLAAGDWASVEAASAEHTVKAFFPRGMTQVAAEQRVADLGAQVLPLYDAMFGALPMREVHFITVPPSFPAAGMGLLGNVMLAEYIFGAYDYLLEQGVAHELAHSWWGNLSGGVGDEAAFMSEAFAEYSAWRALGQAKGDAVRTAGMRMNAVWYMYATPAGQDVAPLSANVTQKPGFVFVTYHKGPLVLRTLEERVGVEVFTAALKALVARGPGGTGMAELVADVKAAGGPDLTADVDQWLKHAGFPKLKVTASEGGAHWSVACEGLCSFTLPVRVRRADGTTSEVKLPIAPGTTEHALPAGGAVETREADPRWTAVREVKPAEAGDVTLDGTIDGRDLLEVAVRLGGSLPEQRRVDGHYDPLFDVNGDLTIDSADLAAVVGAAR